MTGVGDLNESTTMFAHTLSGRFEARLDTDPFAPAVTLRRSNGVIRVWTRAAVEHRAVRLGAWCVCQGLGATARVSVRATGALDAIAATWFVLASGRVLATADAAGYVIDDKVLAAAQATQEPYKLRNFALPKDPALAFGDEVVDHLALLKMVSDPRFKPLLPEMTWAALRYLANGEPIAVHAAGQANIRNAISAA